MPLLNGVSRMAVLSSRFDAEHVLGGACGIGALLEPSAEVRHVGGPQCLAFGEVSRERSARCEAIAGIFASAKIDATLSDHIMRDVGQVRHARLARREPARRRAPMSTR